MTIKITCPHCEQPIEAPGEVIGTVVPCPTCTKEFHVGSKTQQPISSIPKQPPQKSKSILGAVRNFICACSGLKPLEDFRISYFYSSIPRVSKFHPTGFFFSLDRSWNFKASFAAQEMLLSECTVNLFIIAFVSPAGKEARACNPAIRTFIGFSFLNEKKPPPTTTRTR